MGFSIDTTTSADATGDSYMNLTESQRDTIQSVERLGASLSLVGVFFIFVTFGVFKRLRTVPNTFILFASIANVGASTACLIGYSGVLAGDPSALCQVQGFLLEMFMQADPWWSLAMAVNVYMVFFRAANPTSFRRYLWAYNLVCFGVPAIPALVCLVVRNNSRGLIYGNATLWCWIGDSYNSVRIFSYYMPIWGCILLSAIIYIAVGYHVFHHRNQLRNLSFGTQARDGTGSDLNRESSGEKVLTSRSYGTVTTEVQITAESSSDAPSPPPSPAHSIAPIAPVILPAPSAARAPTHPWASPPGGADPTSFRSPLSSSHHNSPFQTSISSAPQPQTNNKKQARFTIGDTRRPIRQFVRRLQRMDPVKLAYLRTSFVFAISVLVTWTPSSINRVYTLVHPEAANYPLNLASSVVLPLQGVWNAVIYAATSWGSLRTEMHDLGRRFGWWGGRGAERLPEGRVVGRSGYAKSRSWTGADDMDIEMTRRGGMGTVRVIRDGSL